MWKGGKANFILSAGLTPTTAAGEFRATRAKSHCEDI
jgi:hypothetical protein